MWRENYGKNLFKVFLNPKYLQKELTFFSPARHKFSVPSLMVSFTRNSHSSSICLVSLALHCLSSPNSNDCSLRHTNACLQKQTQLDQQTDPCSWYRGMFCGWTASVNITRCILQALFPEWPITLFLVLLQLLWLYWFHLSFTLVWQKAVSSLVIVTFSWLGNHMPRRFLLLHEGKFWPMEPGWHAGGSNPPDTQSIDREQLAPCCTFPPIFSIPRILGWVKGLPFVFNK